MTAPMLTAALLSVVVFSQTAAAQGNVPELLIEYPDLIVHNAKIITIDDTAYNSNPGTIAQAMAVRDGKILTLGSSREVLALRGPDTEVIDIRGKTILPGFVNNHHHPQGTMEDIAREMFDLPGALEGFYINLIVAPTADETMAKIARAVGMLNQRMQVRPSDWLGIELLPDGDAFPDIGSVSFPENGDPIIEELFTFEF
jgi:hypothetical protein